MKIWITKYALTAGVLVRNGEPSFDSEMMGYIDEGRCKNYVHKPHWHTSQEEALSHAEDMRAKKLQSLENQIAKIRNLQIKIKEQDQ